MKIPKLQLTLMWTVMMTTRLEVCASSHAMLATLEWELPLQLVVVTIKMT